MSALRELVAHFSVSFDDAELKKGVAALGSAVDAVKSFAGALGIGLGLSALKEFTLEANNQVLALDKQARGLRTSVEDLQRWQQAAQMSGASTDALNSALEQMRGRSAKPTEALMQVADRVAALRDPTQRARLGTAMLGQSYADLAPLLEKGSKGIKGLISEADDLGAVFGKDTVEAAKANRVELGKLSVFMSGLKTELAAGLLPQFTSLLRLLTPAIKWFRELTRNTQLFRATTLLLVGGGIFKAIKAFGGLANILKLLTRQFFTIVAPILILEDFLTFMQGGKSAFGEIVERLFGKGSAEKVRTWINDTVQRVKTWLTDTWTAFKPYVMDVIALAKRMVTEPAQVWKEFTDGISQMWSDFVAWVKSSWLGLAIAAMIEASFTEVEFAVQALWKTFSWLFDYITTGWGLVFEAVNKVAGIIPKVIDTIPGARKVLETNFGKTATNAIAGKSPEERQRDGWYEAAVARGKAIGFHPGSSAANNSQSTTDNSETHITVQVPPGTPKETADRTARAVAKVVKDKKNNQATRSALVPGQG